MLSKSLLDKIAERNNGAKRFAVVRVGYRTHIFECMNEAVEYAIASYDSSDETVEIELHDETEIELQPEEVEE